MWRKLRPAGLLIVSMRDYDQLVRERPGATVPRRYADPDSQRIYVQVWAWAADGRTYLMLLFLIREVADHWETDHHATQHRALLRGRSCGGEEASRTTGAPRSLLGPASCLLSQQMLPTQDIPEGVGTNSRIYVGIVPML